MKIVAICQRSYLGVTPAGGAERMIHALLSRLSSEGWDAEAVVTNYRGEDVDVEGVLVRGVRGETGVAKVCASADVIITHLGASLFAKRVGRAVGRPVVQLVHNTNEYTQGFLGSGCDFAIYNSEWVKSFLEQNQSGIVMEITSGKTVDLRRRSQSEWPSLVVHPPVADVVPNPPAGPDGFVTLVNLVPNKGPDVFYHLAERNPRIRFRGVIGGYEENHQVIRQLPNVEIHPHTTDMDKVYAEASVVLMPSIYESYGLVALEAMGHGVPVIASPTPGLQECLGGSGWFRGREDLDGWNQALAWTLDNHDARSRQSSDRHLELSSVSAVEMEAFVDRMEEVARGANNDRRR